MSRQKYNFAHHVTTDFIYDANTLINKHEQYSYKGVDIYQLSSFKNPSSKFYHVRRFAITPNNEIASVKEYRLTHEQITTLKDKLKHNQFKSFAVYNFDDVAYPDINDMLLAQSQMISHDNDYTGFAKI